nr:MAG TPA: hypothetical protein [Caudoviricetes sp.]
MVFVHHLEIVVLSFPSSSANHLLVLSLSARTDLIRFNFLLAIFFIIMNSAKVNIFFQRKNIILTNMEIVQLLRTQILYFFVFL